jgi:M6 family metalloprotease-like protein
MHKSPNCFWRLIVILWSGILFAAPFTGDEWQLKQPDGSLVSVKVFGDEFYQRVESPDGYTLIRNEQGWICYATLSASGDLIATDRVYRNFLGLKKELSLSKGIDVLPAKRQSLALAKKAELVPAGDGNTLSSSSSSPVVGNIIGLTILIDFSDNAATIPKASIDSALNFQNYRGTAASVRDYYYEISSNKLTYTNLIVDYYRAAQPMSYYDDPNATGRARELVGEVLKAIDPTTDFKQVTASTNTILAVNILYAGSCTAGWSKGLWPHSGSYSYTTGEGVRVSRYQMTGLGSGTSTSGYINTMLHENGHMVCKWADLYDYGSESKGAGSYDIMASGGVIPNGYYRAKCGWETPVDLTNAAPGTLFRHVPNSYSSFVYKNPNNSKEFFYVESRRKGGRFSKVPDSGLIIWHVDEAGSNDNEQMTPTQHYLVSVEQMDGQYHLEKNVNSGADGDLLHEGYKTVFSDATEPNAKWWNGTNSSLVIGNVSKVGPEMTFTIGSDPVRIASGTLDLKNLQPLFTISGERSNLVVNYHTQGGCDFFLRMFDYQGRCVQAYNWRSNSGTGVSETRSWQSSLSAGRYCAMLTRVPQAGKASFEKTGLFIIE